MTDKEVADMLKETGLPTVYYQYPIKMAPPLPYTVYYYPNTDNFGADDKVYTKISSLNVELYTAKKSPAIEAQVEAVLESHNLFWNKTEAFLDSENMYEVLYEMEIING